MSTRLLSLEMSTRLLSPSHSLKTRDEHKATVSGVGCGRGTGVGSFSQCMR